MKQSPGSRKSVHLFMRMLIAQAILNRICLKNPLAGKKRDSCGRYPSKWLIICSQGGFTPVVESGPNF